MKIYKVKALYNFDDYLGRETIPENPHFMRYRETKEREASIWEIKDEEWITAEKRTNDLKSSNAIEIIGIENREEDTVKEEKEAEEKDEIEEEIKKIVKSRKRRVK